MKKLFYIGAVSALLLTACAGEKAETTDNAQEESDTAKEIESEKKEERKATEAEEKTPAEQESKEKQEKQKVSESKPKDDKSETVINTSIFEYAKNVEVVDSRDLTKHITLKIDLANDAQPGMGTLNVLNQTFDFLGQDDVKGADTISILVRVNGIKVSQFTVHTAKFKPNDTTPMAELVLAASDIDFITPEVKSFGETRELW